ncbi:MAG TPA: hypothetical protein DCK98_14495 [Chloroflexi bacterium]|jgi:hypothetical protein|nr:hypothetical protein [Chloroflexota bacterium]HAL28724.1 hypothetical protein [Chloroflexota bacterium]
MTEPTRDLENRELDQRETTKGTQTRTAGTTYQGISIEIDVQSHPGDKAFGPAAGPISVITGTYDLHVYLNFGLPCRHVTKEYQFTVTGTSENGLTRMTIVVVSAEAGAIKIRLSQHDPVVAEYLVSDGARDLMGPFFERVAWHAGCVGDAPSGPTTN